jgi:heat shock protein HtpX
MNVAAYFWSDKFAIRASGAKPVSEEEAPELHKIVNELSELYQVPKPRVYMIPSEQPNAFATGRNPKHAAVAVTQGLLQHMPYDQVRAVMAHEFAHIKNRDILVSSIAAMIAGAVSAIGNIFFFTAMFGGDDDDSPLGALGAIVLLIIGPIAAALLQLGVSRQREYLADATAARMLREGRPLAEALETLESARHVVPMAVNPATETLYIVNPFSGAGVTKLFSTHPPIEDRIKRLREYDRAAGIHYG